MTVRFSLAGLLDATSVELDLDGDGSVEFTGPSLDGQVFTYPQPGVYVPVATVTDAQGQRHTARAVLLVYDGATLDTLLQARWRSLKDALRQGDIARAVGAITERPRADYQAAFQILATELPNIDAILTDIRLVRVRNASAIYRMLRVNDGLPLSFGVRFAVDTDGVWRIEAF